MPRMRPRTCFIVRVVDHWEARWRNISIRSTHETRNAALASALSTAQDLWNGQRTPCEIRMCEDDGKWYDVATFGIT
jgi:hypothetical protein